MGRLGLRNVKPEKLAHRRDHKKVSLAHRIDHDVHQLSKKVGRQIMKHGDEISAVGKGAIIASRVAGGYGLPVLGAGVVASTVGSIGAKKQKQLEARKEAKKSKMLKTVRSDNPLQKMN